MHSVVLVDCFPLETFVIRQVESLNSDVVTGVIYTDNLKTLGLSTNVTSITNGQTFKGSFKDQVINKIKNAMLGGWLPRWSGLAEKQWRNYLKTNKPDVVLAQFGTNAIRCMSACRDYNIPFVAHFHGYDASELLKFPSYCEKLKDVFETASACIVVSHVMKSNMIKLGCNPDKLHVIPCGVPVADFPLGNQQNSQPCHFVAVGRFVDKKAPLLIVKAFEKCAESVPGVHLTMIGDGSLLEATIQFSKQSKFSRQMNILGRQSNVQVSEIMQSAGCFVQHSVTAISGDQEGWPVAIAEACSTGLPVIATRHAGIPEQVLDGETGYLSYENDWEDMGDKMAKVANSPDWRQQAGLKAREHIEKTGDFDRMKKKLSELLNSVSRTEH